MAVHCRTATAQDPPRFGGPDAVQNQLEADEEEKQPLSALTFLDPYRRWKEGVREKTGLHFAGDYSAQGLASDESSSDDEAGAGIARFFGSWDLVDRDGDHPGSFVWKLEYRHAFTDLPPAGFAFDQGYVGLIAPPFSEQRVRTTNLYWKQRFAGGRYAVIAGFLDATDYLDVYPFASPWTGFTNLAFSTGSAAIALPNDALLGIAAAGMLTDHLYAIASLGDSNGDPEHPFNGFETFADDREYFTSFEIGWTPSQQRLVSDNLHLTLWHVDERDAAGTPSGWGVNVSATTTLDEHWTPFLRAGWTRDAGSLLDRSVSMGFGYQALPGRDLLGVAANWGRPNRDTFGSVLDDQWTFEIFYRWQLLRELVVTPSVQLLVSPALDPSENAVWVFGLRLRYAL
jgi:porin